MKITKLHPGSERITDTKTQNLYQQMQTLLNLIEEKKIQDTTAEQINRQIETVNSTSLTGKAFYGMLKKAQTDIIKNLEKQEKIVPRNYYRNIWLAAGMGAFGLPIGAIFGISMGNIALLGIGLPVGMAIGIGLGTTLDKKAAAEGRQLDIEIK